MALRIITDSSCDLPFSIQKDWNIDILSFHVLFGDNEYIDGQNLNRQQFYRLMSEAPTLPKTAQISPYEFKEVFNPYVQAGDEILVLPISKERSGTYNGALLAKASYTDASIHVVDTLNVTFALALLVEVAVKLRDEGLDAKSIVEKIDELKKRIRLYAVIDDLKYLKMGGRLSSAGAAVGTLLNIKPIISVVGGKVVGIDKARGQKAGYQSIINYAKKDGIDNSYPVYFGHSNFPDAMDKLKILAGEQLKMNETRSADIGPVVGTHAGPGAVGLAFISAPSSN